MLSKHEELINKHPLILGKPGGWPGVGEGWLPLLDELCTAIQARILEKNLPQLEAVQIKEKFGGLRFYHNANYDDFKDLTEAAERKADKTCEVCGEPGELHSPNGWMKTVCELHKG